MPEDGRPNAFIFGKRWSAKRFSRGISAAMSEAERTEKMSEAERN
jgi:hypothetical protein